MKRFRLRLTYSNVVATLSLFLLLGGGAYAATRLPRNSVGPRQIRRNAVSTAKIKNGAVTKRKLAAATVRALEGTPGATGPVGPSDLFIGGAAVAPLSSSYVAVATTTVPAGSYEFGAKVTIFTALEKEAGFSACYIGPSASSANGEWDGVSVSLAGVEHHPAAQVMSLVGAGNLAAESAVVLACKSSEGTLTADNARVWAVKVGSLHGLPVPTD